MDRPLFSASLTPNHSLSPRGRRMVVATLAVGASIPGLVMFAAGAWPVVGFMGLDVAAVWWALSASMRQSTRSEHVSLWPDSLEVRQVSPEGDERTSRFNPFFVRLQVSRDVVGRVTGLTLTTADTALPIGSFLSPTDKASFARALGAALARARG
jgi:uncharacterized membrane protein